MFTADWKVISSLLRSLSTHFPVRLPDCTGWKRSPTENSAGDAISVGALWNPCRTTNQHFKKHDSLQYKEKGIDNKFGKSVFTFENLTVSGQMIFSVSQCWSAKLLIQSSLDVPLDGTHLMQGVLLFEDYFQIYLGYHFYPLYTYEVEPVIT